MNVQRLKQSCQAQKNPDPKDGVILELIEMLEAAEVKMVLDGWQLVPVEPDWEMLSADGCKEHHNGQPCLHHDNRKRIWSAMLAAAPSPPK